MTREEILGKIEAAGGKWVVKDFAFTKLDNDGQVRAISTIGGAVGGVECTWYLFNYYDDPKNFHCASTGNLEGFKHVLASAIMLANIFGVDLELDGESTTQVIEKAVTIKEPADLSVQHRLEGEVKVYEKLLTGREITIGR